jgi:hypothetical protein
LHAISDVLELDAEGSKRASGDSVSGMDHAEEDVLGTDVVVTEQACLFLRQNQDSSGLVGESFERAAIFAPLGCRRPGRGERTLGVGSPYDSSASAPSWITVEKTR